MGYLSMTQKKKKREKTTKPKNQHYVDNEKFLAAMTEWKELCKIAEEQGDERPPLSDYIGECFIKIASGVGKMGNFIGYSYRDEMIADGIENCVRYAHNFDPEKSTKNPFSYFTTMVYYAFIRRIKKEKQQSAIKQKCIQNAIESGVFDGDINYLGINHVIQDLQSKLNSEIEAFEIANNSSVSKKKKNTTTVKTSSSSSIPNKDLFE